jgi:hypothetical protein
MGFNKKYLPELQDLVKIRNSYGSDEEFIDSYLRRVDAILGPSDSCSYLREIRDRVEDGRRMAGEKS